MVSKLECLSIIFERKNDGKSFRLVRDILYIYVHMVGRGFIYCYWLETNTIQIFMSNLLFALSTCLILCNFNVRLIVVFDAGFGYLQKKILQ